MATKLKTVAHDKMMEALHRETPEKIRPRLLVIEDDSGVRETLQMVLNWEYEIVSLSSGGDDILQTLDGYRPNLILMDVNLPGRDGFRLCEIIRASPRHRHIPVLFLTVRKDTASFVRFLQAYGDAYLNKPFEAKDLRGTIRRLLKTAQ